MASGPDGTEKDWRGRVCLPLPEGEGRGEGEGSLQISPIFATTKAPGLSQLIAGILLVTVTPTFSAATPDQIKFFEEKIRPVLSTHCYECHGPQKQKAELRLDSREGILKGSYDGPVVVPGKPTESALIRAVKHEGEFKMPAKQPRLADTQIAALERWVAMGVPWPAHDKPAPEVTKEAGADTGPKLRKRKFEITDEDRTWWSFQPLRRPAVPKVKRRADIANDIDAFLLARLEAKQLGFSPLASRRELIRRAYFDLIGLPPTPEAVAAFERDRSPGAWEALIDDLLSRPQYGERWARHWLDVVRYAESNGYERDGTKPNAWRYRDYVIQSLNSDKPYDRFILEQLAGDELEPGLNPEAIIATGFYRLHVWDDEPDSTLAAEFDDLDDIMVTTSAAFLGVTMGCARCHDHKFDPFSQADYYQMLAFMRSISPYGLHKTGGGGRGTGRISRPLATAEEIAAWEREKERRLKPLRDQHADPKNNAGMKKKLEEQMRQIGDGAPFGSALAIAEDPIKPTHLFRRGDVNSPADEVQPLLPIIFGGAKPEFTAPWQNSSSGRRLALAKWIARPDNPLTARVMVNRLWQHHFGHGLVRTPNDFGRTGLKPSHPELLDYLASDFVKGGWKLKRLHKLILMSRAYRMSSHTPNRDALTIDEGNELLWRQNPRRAESEVLRDSMLAVSGALNPKMGGPSFFPSLPKEVLRTQDGEGKGWQESPVQEQNRRSIYTFIKRALLPPLLETFDYTTTTLPVGERSVTTVAPQALMLLNDAFVQQTATRLAERLVREAGADETKQVQRAFELCVQRAPTPPELQAARALLREQVRLAGSAHPEQDALRSLCVGMFNLNEFVYVD